MISSWSKSLCVFVFFSFIFNALKAQQTTPPAANRPMATVREYKQNFPTYPFSDPDPVAKVGRLYPYFRYDGYTNQRTDKEWTVVELENEWIKVLILPQVGGKIWTAIEKSTGKPFIYYNHAVKFRDIALRGPWTSGGIEMNYGIIGHTPATSVPVNYAGGRRSDGTAYCMVSAFDLLTRTHWTMTVELPGNKAYFITKSSWHNSNPLEQPYYTWMNTGIKAAGNLEFTYTGTHHLGHAGEVAAWPRRTGAETDKGIANYERNNFGSYKSYHVFGQHTSFFGGYWHDEGFGMGRYAPRDEKPGKKIWIWGLSRQGMIWDKLLTDTDGQYVEVQSGRLFTQSAPGSITSPFKYRGFAPYATDEWSEYWFPVLKTGGMVEANPYGALNVAVKGQQLDLAFCPLQAIDDSLKVFEDKKLIFSTVLKKNTLETANFSVNFKGNIEKTTVELGRRKLYWSGNPADGQLDRPTASPADFDWNSAYGHYIKAKAFSEQREYDKAIAHFDTSLRRDPYHMPALTGKATEYIRIGRYAEAAELSTKALSIDTYDPAANYHWGLANAKLGKTANAKDGFELATQSVEYRTAAYTELAKIYAREKDWMRADEYAQKANPTQNNTARLIRSVANRYMGRMANYSPANYPFSIMDWLESNSQMKPLIRDEMPQEHYLEAAAFYLDLGLPEDARRALYAAPDVTEKWYLLAWLEHSMGDPNGQSNDLLQRAIAASPYLVFPFRSESLPALQWADQKRSSWKTRYYLALLQQHLGRPDEARRLLTACGNEPDYAPFYLSRALLTDKTNAAAAEQDLQRARTLDTKSWRPARYLSQHYKQQKNYPKMLETTEKAVREFAASYILQMEHAEALLFNGRYNDCLQLLSTVDIIPYEGATEGHGLYRNACLLAALEALDKKDFAGVQALTAKAKLWPENLGVGKPYDADIDLRVEQYIEALALEASGKKKEATTLLQQIATAPDAYRTSAAYVSILAAKRLGQTAKADELLSGWVKAKPADAVARWAANGARQAAPEGSNAMIFARLVK
jgi:tetratricopeptide (TPR) repeat protein